MINKPLKLGFLASGNGTSARAIIAAIQSGDLAAEACVLVSNNRSAPALSFAADAGVPAHCVPTQAEPAAADQRLVHAGSPLDDDGVSLADAGVRDGDVLALCHRTEDGGWEPVSIEDYEHGGGGGEEEG